MTAAEFLFAMIERGFDFRLDAKNRLLVNPSRRLTDADRAAIRAHLPALKRLCSNDYSGHPDGWNSDPDLPSRAVLVRGGRLMDSACFESADAAADFLRRVQTGESATFAFRAAVSLKGGA
ncbi:MAG: hypothetical protein AB1344_06275 [Pseudomonadota bacterium]